MAKPIKWGCPFSQTIDSKMKCSAIFSYLDEGGHRRFLIPQRDVAPPEYFADLPSGKLHAILNHDLSVEAANLLEASEFIMPPDLSETCSHLHQYEREDVINRLLKMADAERE